MSIDSVRRVAQMIRDANCMNKKASKIHVQTIQKNQKILNDKISQNICPKCGNELIEKLGKKGKFISCSEYPRCRYAS